MTITGMRVQCGPRRMRFRTSRPPMPGKFKSKSTRPGHVSLVSALMPSRKERASCPSLAIRTFSFSLHSSRMSRITKMSAALSSTSRTVAMLGWFGPSELAFSPLSGSGGKGEAEGRAFAGNGTLQPDAAAILLHDTLADCQANAASRMLLPAMKPFE